MKRQAHVSVTACAFEDPGTRMALQEAWRRARVRFVAWTAVWALLLVTVGVFKGGSTDAVAAVALFLMLVSLRPLVLSALSLRCLRTIDTVLRARPWEYKTSVRRARRGKASAGIPVQVRTGDGEDDWTPVMVARAPFRWRRWSGEMESGAWFAGDLARGGVLALPGGHGLTLVRSR
ncbi:hypothetical protein [Streptomyces enissocaesilis]|uniref:Integral membrane protein n=1 Tax=Streptomyces enissocaesilis TaxID=332589 RepID=A0ABP6K3N7_9ACTN